MFELIFEQALNTLEINYNARSLRIDSVVREAERIINISLSSIESIYINIMNNKTTNIFKDKHHLAHDYFLILPSQKKMRTFKGNKRFKKKEVSTSAEVL